jgi:hypothetical protein
MTGRESCGGQSRRPAHQRRAWSPAAACQERLAVPIPRMRADSPAGIPEDPGCRHGFSVAGLQLPAGLRSVLSDLRDFISRPVACGLVVRRIHPHVLRRTRAGPVRRMHATGRERGNSWSLTHAQWARGTEMDAGRCWRAASAPPRPGPTRRRSRRPRACAGRPGRRLACRALEIGTGIRDSPDALRAAGRHCQ